MLVLSRVQDGHLIYLPYFLRAIILIPQLKKVLRLRGYVPFVNFGAYREKLIVLTMTMLVIIFLGMCSFHLFETRFPSNQPISSSNLSLTQLLYYIVITVSTVGYGDITPKTVAGQLVVVVMILVSIIVIPGLVTDVQETFKLQQSGAGSYTRGSRKYIVVCGVFDTVARVETVLSMIFSKKATSKTKIILLARNKQSVHVKALLNQSHFRGRVVYLQGSGLDLEDLKRVQLKYADAAFILADTNAVNKKEEDEHNTLRAWAFDDYAPMTPLYVDNLLPGTEVLQDRTTSGSVCIDDLKQILLAYNCLYRGVGTLMVNLLRPCPLHGDYEDLWRAQYADGLANEIHQSDLNPAFAAYPFTAISYYVFKEFQVILFGVGVKTMSKNHAEVLHVLLNPGGTYVLKPSDTCLYMAQSEDDVRAINNLTRDEFERTMMQHSFSMAIHGSLARRPSAEDLANTPFQDSLMAEIYVKGYPTSINHDDWTPLCWLLAEPQCLEQVAIADAGFLQSHILVCTYTYTIFRFVCTLRSANLTAKELKPIVFLCPRLPTDEEFELLARFPQLYFVVGDATVQRDLERGNVHGSGKVVIINMQRSTSSSSSMDDFSDSSAIMVAHLIHNMFHRSGLRKYVVIHLHKRTNIKFLRPTARKRAHKRKVSALRRPTSSDLQHDWQDDVFFAPVFAAGRALSTSMIEPVLFHTYTNPFILDIFNAFCGVQYKKNQDMHDQLGIDRAGLCYVTVPPEFVHLPFGKLYENLACSVGVIPIGLLREEVDQAGLGNKLPFIVANPPFSLLLKETDLVYVLASPKQVL
nr:potassium channel, sub T, member 2 [Polyrhizophydium stewartii]